MYRFCCWQLEHILWDAGKSTNTGEPHLFKNTFLKKVAETICRCKFETCSSSRHFLCLSGATAASLQLPVTPLAVGGVGWHMYKLVTQRLGELCSRLLMDNYTQIKN